MKQKISFCIVLALICSATLYAQKTIHSFSVQDCLSYAVKNNYQVKNALLDVAIQQQDNRAITAGALPAINGSASYTDYLQIPTQLLPGQFFGQPAGTYIPVKFGTQYNALGAVTLRQVLFDGQVFVGLQARKTSIDYRQKAADITVDMIRENIYKVYYQLVISKTQTQILDANISQLQNLLHVNTELNKNGFAEKLDVNKTAVQLTNLQTTKQSTTSTINNGYYGLKVLLGMPEQDSLVLTDSITEDNIKQGLLNEGVYKYSDRNEYQSLQFAAQLNGYNVKRYKLSYLPTLSLLGNFTRQGQGTNYDIFGKKGVFFTSSYVGVSIAVPIFDGFEKDANIKKARLQLSQTQNQLDALKIAIDNEALQAVNDYHTAINTLDYQNKNVALAEQVYQETQKKYESGLTAIIDVTNAQTDLEIAQNNYINSMYNAVIAQIDYLYATGQLK